MRILVAILLLISVRSQGQVIMASAPYRPTATCSYLLGQYGGAAAAYSLRKLSCSYAGSAIRVRRSSDNTESDIGFTSAGDLDTAALKTFVGTGGSDNGFVVTWYSQVNGYDISQSTAAAQPIILTAGVIERSGGLPSIYFGASGADSLKASNFMGSSTNATLYVVNKINIDPPITPNEGAFVDFTGQDLGTHQPFSDGNIYDGFGTTVRKNTGNPSFNMSAINLYTVITSASDWRSYINNSLHYSTTSNTVSFTKELVVGSSRVNNAYLGRISEIIIYDNSSNDRNGISSNINAYYTIY